MSADNGNGSIDQKEQQDLQNKILLEAQALHLDVLYFLELTESQLSFDAFQRYIKMIEMLIIVRGIKIELLSPAHIKLLAIYYIACQLKKSGVVSEIDFDRIKKEKINELEIGYYPRGGGAGDDEEDRKSFTSVNKLKASLGFCELFDKLLDSLVGTMDDSLLTIKKFCVGATGSHNKGGCCK